MTIKRYAKIVGIAWIISILYAVTIFWFTSCGWWCGIEFIVILPIDVILLMILCGWYILSKQPQQRDTSVTTSDTWSNRKMLLAYLFIVSIMYPVCDYFLNPFLPYGFIEQILWRSIGPILAIFAIIWWVWTNILYNFGVVLVVFFTILGIIAFSKWKVRRILLITLCIIQALQVIVETKSLYLSKRSMEYIQMKSMENKLNGTLNNTTSQGHATWEFKKTR